VYREYYRAYIYTTSGKPPINLSS